MVRQEPRHRNLDKEDNAILESTWMRWVDLFRGLFSLLPSRVSSGMIWHEEESGGRDRLRGCWRAKMKGDDISSRLGMSAATDFISPLLLLSFSFSFSFLIYPTRDTWCVQRNGKDFILSRIDEEREKLGSSFAFFFSFFPFRRKTPIRISRVVDKQ